MNISLREPVIEVQQHSIFQITKYLYRYKLQGPRLEEVAAPDQPPAQTPTLHFF